MPKINIHQNTLEITLGHHHCYYFSMVTITTLAHVQNQHTKKNPRDYSRLLPLLLFFYRDHKNTDTCLKPTYPNKPSARGAHILWRNRTHLCAHFVGQIRRFSSRNWSRFTFHSAITSFVKNKCYYMGAAHQPCTTWPQTAFVIISLTQRLTIRIWHFQLVC